MSNLVDLWSESQASLIGDDAQPSLTLSNSSTGPGLRVDRVVSVSGATVGAFLTVNGGIQAANATIVGFQLTGASRASGAVLAFKGDGLVSCVSIVFAASANWGGLRAARVVLESGDFGWIPVLPNAVVTAAATP